MEPSDLSARLAALPPLKRLAFLLSCAERMYPNYLEFHRRHGWGRPEVIRRALDLVWSSLEGKDVGDDIPAVQQQCEEVMPDTEDFDTIYVSSALDAAVVASILLSLLQDQDVGKVLEGLSLARDTVDMYVQELEGMDPGDPNLEDRIARHPLMKQETRRWLEALDLLERTVLSQPSGMAELKRQWRSPAKSSIELGSVS
jgi:uncharacterized protein